MSEGLRKATPEEQLAEVTRGAVDVHTREDLLRKLQGAYAIAVFCREEPHRVIGARSGSPLVIGVGVNENFLASDALALAGVTDRFIYLEEGDVADLQLGRVWLVDRHGQPVPQRPGHVDHVAVAPTGGPFDRQPLVDVPDRAARLGLQRGLVRAPVPRRADDH